MAEERESMELDVVFVGAGPANLAAAYRLMTNINAYNEKAESEGKEPIEEPMVLVIEKGANVGNHNLSGAVVDPIAFQELFPAMNPEEWPFITPVKEDRVYKLMGAHKFMLPEMFLPGEMSNEGNYIASISEITRWLSEKCEELGVEIYSEFSANELMIDNDHVVGVKIGDKGIDEEGKPTDNFTPGMDLEAKVTVIGEGTRGYLATELIEQFKLDADANKQCWGLGLKELIEVPSGRVKKGQVFHTMFFPFDFQTYGGSFIYALEDNLVALGIVYGLDYKDPYLNSHDKLLQFKKHPFVKKMIEGGTVKEYGAKTLPEGGYYAIPKLAVPGAVLVGDSAGMLNCMRLKGVHLAMKSGMMAADKIFEAMQTDDFSAGSLDYREEFENSWAGKELYKARNFRQSFEKGMIPGLIWSGLHMFTGGKLPGGRKTMHADYETLKKAGPAPEPAKMETDENLNLDILTDVYKSGTIHNEHQPSHCKILDNETCKKCREEYAMPCTRFCPAQVYEEELDEEGNFVKIQVNFSNCVHCKTCEIKDPYRNVKWVLPEGGDGPKYQRM
ncbi:MAG: 4Fe-4S dicluster domain-containing protein [Candidatus Sumerlaeia bacterium]